MDRRKGEFQWGSFTFDKHLCRNIFSDKNTGCHVAFEASLTAFSIDPSLNLTASHVSLHSLTIRSPWDILGNSDWLKGSDPFLGR